MIQTIVTAFEKLANARTKQTLRRKGVATITDLPDACKGMDVDIAARQMTVDMFGGSE